MDFLGEIENLVGAANSFSVEVGEKFGYAFGVKRILSFDKNRLSFLVGKTKTIDVLGDDLHVVSFISGDVEFFGKVNLVEIKSI